MTLTIHVSETVKVIDVVEYIKKMIRSFVDIFIYFETKDTEDVESQEEAATGVPDPPALGIKVSETTSIKDKGPGQ